MNITILGAGAYALALAYRFNENNNIIMWSAIESEIDELYNTRQSSKIKNLVMPSKIEYTKDIEYALNKSDIVVIAVATKFVKSVCETIKEHVKDKIIVIASKGIEQDSLMFSSMIAKETLNSEKICVISGPSFAIDIVNLDNVIGLSLASSNKESINIVKNAISNNTLKIRTTEDTLGVELCGAIKNVIAVASGIIDGLKACDSTRAMFLTECINDVRHVIRKFGGNEKTVLSFAGIGDILLTSTSLKSRNYVYGKMVGENNTKEVLDDYLKNNTVEGVYTLVSLYNLTKSKEIEIPFLEVIYNILFNDLEPNTLLKFILEKEN